MQCSPLPSLKLGLKARCHLVAIVWYSLVPFSVLAGGNSTSGHESKGSAPASIPLFHLANKPGQKGFGVFIEAKIGTPPERAQYVTLLLDSGSSSMAVIGPRAAGLPGPLPPCTLSSFHTRTGRSSCGLGGYTARDSPSHVRWPLPGSQYCPIAVNDTTRVPFCAMSVNYGDGSGFTGMMVNDTLTIGGYSQTAPVNAIYWMHGPFQEPPSAGIIGVAGADLNCARWGDPKTCFPGAMEQLLMSQGLKNRLGLCLGRPPLPTGSDHNRIDYGQPGLMSLGGTDTALTAGRVYYSKILQGTKYFALRLQGVGVNEQHASVPTAAFASGMIVDTGSTQLYLPYGAWTAISAAGAKIRCHQDSDCRLSIQVQGACLKLVDFVKCHPQHRVCSALEQRGLAYGQPMLGFAGMKDLYLELDLSDHQVGFATRSNKACNAKCSSFLTKITCSFAKGCAWEGTQCGGGMSSGGSKSRGSTVTAECFNTR